MKDAENIYVAIGLDEIRNSVVLVEENADLARLYHFVFMTELGCVLSSSCGSPRTNPDPLSAETLKQTSTTYDQLSPKTDDHNPRPHDPRIGLVLDSKYQLLDRLGEGGMGSVYRARRLHIGDEVAVKLLSHNLVRDHNAIERFRREARSAAMIRHPNVVSIHDFNDASYMNEAYIVMELVRGESLRKVLEREGRLPARTRCLIDV